jgi:hypothetical protein
MERFVPFALLPQLTSGALKGRLGTPLPGSPRTRLQERLPALAVADVFVPHAVVSAPAMSRRL